MRSSRAVRHQTGFQPIQTTTRYTSMAVFLHWGIAVLIFGLLTLGLYMTGLPLSPDKLQLYSWHKWAGVSLFMLALIRVIWRLFHAPPPLPGHMSRLARLAAHAGHALLYILLFAIPLSGWLMSSAKGFQTVWFGVLPLPDLIDKNRELGNLLQSVHWYPNLLLMATLAAHIGAALKHHFIDRDDILKRMLPGR